jgi:hypothetical protein
MANFNHHESDIARQTGASVKQVKQLDPEVDSFTYSQDKGMIPAMLGQHSHDLQNLFKREYTKRRHFVGYWINVLGNPETIFVPFLIFHTKLRSLHGMIADIKDCAMTNLTDEQCVAVAFAMENYQSLANQTAGAKGVISKIGAGIDGALPYFVSQGSLGGAV